MVDAGMIPLALASALAIAYAVALFLVVLVIPLTVTALKGQWLLFAAAARPGRGRPGRIAGLARPQTIDERQ